jgi:hypothetical protein
MRDLRSVRVVSTFFRFLPNCVSTPILPYLFYRPAKLQLGVEPTTDLIGAIIPKFLKHFRGGLFKTFTYVIYCQSLKTTNAPQFSESPRHVS